MLLVSAGCLVSTRARREGEESVYMKSKKLELAEVVRMAVAMKQSKAGRRKATLPLVGANSNDATRFCHVMGELKGRLFGETRRDSSVIELWTALAYPSPPAPLSAPLIMSLLDEPVPQDDLMRDRTRIFEEFLTSESAIYNYKDDILRMLRLDRTRLIVNIDDLRDYRRDFADGLLRQPVEFMPAFDDALSTVIQQVHNAEKHEIEGKGYHIGFSGSFGDHHVSPRNLRASYLGQMISLEGIVTRCSLVRPKMLRSVHFCPDTGLFHAREYRDATSSTSNLPPTSSVTPQTDEEGHPLQMEFGFCTFRDHQRISIQEMPERAPAGQLPRSTDVILDDDLVDKCKPGDRIQLVGAYRSVGGGASGTFKYVQSASFDY